MLKEAFVRDLVILNTSFNYITMSWALGDVFHISYRVRSVHFYSHFTDRKN